MSDFNGRQMSYGRETSKETVVQMNHRTAVSMLITGNAIEAWSDHCFIPTKGQLKRLQSDGKTLYVRNEACEWVYHSVDEALNIIENIGKAPELVEVAASLVHRAGY